MSAYLVWHLWMESNHRLNVRSVLSCPLNDRGIVNWSEYKDLNLGRLVPNQVCCRTTLYSDKTWLRELDSNQRPSAYEADEMPTFPSRDNYGGG
jgi:hypothetical protein